MFRDERKVWKLAMAEMGQREQSEPIVQGRKIVASKVCSEVRLKMG